MRWERDEKRVVKRFDKAIEKTGYLSLCSIIESQYYFPRTYPLELIKQPERIEVNRSYRPLQPQQYKIANYRRQHDCNLITVPSLHLLARQSHY